MYKGSYIRIPKKSLELFLREVVFRYNMKDHKDDYLNDPIKYLRN
ncbi:MAG: hypothetical protein ACRC0X_03785 [Brevinema sp.]